MFLCLLIATVMLNNALLNLYAEPCQAWLSRRAAYRQDAALHNKILTVRRLACQPQPTKQAKT